LEARRRRWAQRRIMDVTNAGRGGAGGAMPDMGVLFGVGKMRQTGMDWEWRGPGEVAEDKTYGNDVSQIPLPLWLEDFVAKPEEEDVDGRQTKKTTGGTMKAGKNRLSRHIRKANTLEDVHATLQRLEIDLQQLPECREIVLKSLLKADKLDFAIDILYDHRLNEPGSGFFNMILGYGVQRKLSEKSQQRVLDAILDCTALGMIDAKTIGHIVHTLSNYVNKRWKCFRSEDGLLAFYVEMWKSLESCKVFTGKDLGVEVVHRWLNTIKRLAVSDRSIYLVRCMIEAVPPARELGVEVVHHWLNAVNELPFSDLSVSIVQSMIEAVPPAKDAEYSLLPTFLSKWVKHWHSSVQNDLVLRRSEIPGVAHILSAIPPDIALVYVRTTFSLLTEGFPKDRVGHSIIGAWMTTASDIELLGQRFNLDDATGHISFSPKSLAPHPLITLGPPSDISFTSGRFQVLLLYWTQSLEVPLPEAPFTFSTLSDWLVSYIESQPYSSKISTASTLLLSLHSYHLPYLWLWEPLQSRWFSEPRTCPSLIDFASSLNQHGIHLPLIPLTTQLAAFETAQPLLATKILSLLPGEQNQLYTRPALITALIRNGRLHPHMVLKLCNTLDFRITLPFAHNADPDDESYAPSLALRLFNHLAIEFARSKHVSDRLAFRSVWYLYKLARKNSVPLSYKFSAAMALAGAMRWRQAKRGWGGPNNIQVTNTALAVRFIEGAEAGKQLTDWVIERRLAADGANNSATWDPSRRDNIFGGTWNHHVPPENQVSWPEAVLRRAALLERQPAEPDDATAVEPLAGGTQMEGAGTPSTWDLEQSRNRALFEGEWNESVSPEKQTNQ
jgi:hypothetical protein